MVGVILVVGSFLILGVSFGMNSCRYCGHEGDDPCKYCVAIRVEFCMLPQVEDIQRILSRMFHILEKSLVEEINSHQFSDGG